MAWNGPSEAFIFMLRQPELIAKMARICLHISPRKGIGMHYPPPCIWTVFENMFKTIFFKIKKNLIILFYFYVALIYLYKKI